MKFGFLLIAILFSSSLVADINIYSSRKEHLINPVLKLYTQKTGMKFNLLTDKEQALMQRIKAEGKNTKADLFFTVDAGNLWLASQQGLLEAYNSKVLASNIPKHLRDPKNMWFAFSVRARTIVYNPKKVDPNNLTTYDDLSDAKWKKRLCLRTSKKVYNQSLVAMLIARLGEKKAEKVVSGWVANLATNPFSNDTKLIKAVAAGQCDVGIVNTYYLARLLKKDKNFPVRTFWPNQKSGGVHVNISGAGLVKGSKNMKEAQKFLDWLSSKEAQSLFAELNLEYPVRTDVEPSSVVKKWGDFKPELINVSEAGRLQKKAVMLMDRVGYK